jgi:hypothetical protein
MLPDKALRSLEAAFQRRDPQFVIFDPQYDFISDADTKRLAKRSGDDDTAVFIDT